MEESVLLGRARRIIEIPFESWKQDLAGIPQHGQARLKFMTETHHQIRNFVVKEMLIQQKPIEPQFISKKLSVPLDRVNYLLGELEQKLFFLVRNSTGAVSWGYPITVETTLHKLKFASGERLYGA